jgi:hypothetical protein
MSKIRDPSQNDDLCPDPVVARRGSGDELDAFPPGAGRANHKPEGLDETDRKRRSTVIIKVRGKGWPDSVIHAGDIPPALRWRSMVAHSPQQRNLRVLNSQSPPDITKPYLSSALISPAQPPLLTGLHHQRAAECRLADGLR